MADSATNGTGTAGANGGSAPGHDSAGQWKAVIDGPESASSGGTRGERVLSQDEIDELLGFRADDLTLVDPSGIRAIIDTSMVSYERLPMLEIVFNRLVRLLTTSLRNFTSDTLEVSVDSITSVRFGEYMNSVPLPALLVVVKAERLDGSCLVTIDSSLIYAMIDVLLGGRRGQAVTRVEGRPYTTIETALVRRLVELVLQDAEEALRPVSPVKFQIERLESNPRFVTIAQPSNAAILVRLGIDMEGRGGTIEMLLPYATLEPIRGKLLQSFMGDKFGRDPIWEGHLATEIWQAEVEIDAVLFDDMMPLARLMHLKVGETLLLDLKPDALVKVRCGDVVLTEGSMGRLDGRIAIRIGKPLRRPRTTFAMFETSENAPKRMEAP